jgi:hypothetical protein
MKPQKKLHDHFTFLRTPFFLSALGEADVARAPQLRPGAELWRSVKRLPRRTATETTKTKGGSEIERNSQKRKRER